MFDFVKGSANLYGVFVAHLSWGLLNEGTNQFCLKFRIIQAKLKGVLSQNDVVVDAGSVDGHGHEELHGLKVEKERAVKICTSNRVICNKVIRLIRAALILMQLKKRDKLQLLN